MDDQSQNNEIQIIESTPFMLPTRQDVDAQKNQRDLLRQFVSSQLVEADFKDRNSSSYGDGDFGIIPGTKKRCLFKPGAEKIQKLFKLGTRFTLTHKEIDRPGNFAMFVYKAEIYHIPTGKTIAECEGSTNSHEVKYKTRTVWKNKKLPDGKVIRESTLEDTPVCDVLNTLMKMAQKRAMIGATILAVGATEYFTQDLLDPEDIQTSGTAETLAPKKAPASDSSDGDSTIGNPPQCCGGEMILSKYVDKDLGHKPWYCFKCKNKVPAE